MMGRQRLQELKKLNRKMGYHPDRQTIHALIDHGLEAWDVIDGGRTVTDRNKEIKAGLAELREEIEHLRHRPDFVPRAIYLVDLVESMLTTDYRRYSSWADVRPQMEEEFSR